TQAPTPSPSSTPDDPAALAPVVLVGADLGRLAAPLRLALGRQVVTALDAVTSSPAAVVVEITAGSQTTPRTRTAVTTLQQRFPGVPVLVVGPFGANDRKSAAAAKQAAQLVGATFLDPVAEGWRPATTAPGLTRAQVAGVVEHLAADLAPVLRR
ncbi:MAG: hypothetical protein WCD35_15305, partial [Mycobacteriales bacterium]